MTDRCQIGLGAEMNALEQMIYDAKEKTWACLIVVLVVVFFL